MKPTKLQSLILFVVKNLGYPVGSVELAKILYLIDVERMMLAGDTVTGEEYTRQKKGPLARNFGKAIDSMMGNEITLAIIPTNSGISKKSHSIGNQPRFEPELDEMDILSVVRVCKKIEGLAPLNLEKLAYRTKPMKAITDKEAKLGKLLIGEKVDLKIVSPHPILAKWRANMRIPEKPDPEYEEHLKHESEEADAILAMLGKQIHF